MAINRYMQARPFDFSFYTPPVAAIEQSLKQAKQLYDLNESLSDVIRNKYVNALPQDQAKAREIHDRYEKAIDGIVKKYNGNYARASGDMKNLIRQINSDFGPQGEAGAIQRNFTAVQESLKRERERLAKVEISAHQLNALQNYISKTFQGTTYDSDTGTYTQLNVPELAKFVDWTKLADEALKNTEKRKTRSVRIAKVDKDGRMYYETVEKEVRDENELFSNISSRIANDDGYMDYASQTAQLLGLDPRQYVASTLEDIKTNFVPAHSGVFSDTSEVKLEYDQIAMQNRKFSQEIQLAGLRHKYKLAEIDHKAAKESGVDGSLSFITTQANSDPRLKPVDPNTGLEVKAKGGIPFLGTYDLPFTGQKVSISQILANPAAYKDKVNIELLAAARDRAKQLRGDNVSDKDIWTIHNESLQYMNAGNQIPYFPYNNPKTAENAMKLDQQVLLTGAATAVYADGRPVPADKQQVLGKAMEKAAKGEASIRSLGITSPASGNTIVGNMYTDHDGNVVIVGGTNYLTKEYNEKFLRKGSTPYAGVSKIGGASDFEILEPAQGEKPATYFRTESYFEPSGENPLALVPRSYIRKYERTESGYTPSITKNERGEVIDTGILTTDGPMGREILSPAAFSAERDLPWILRNAPKDISPYENININ